MTTRPDPSRTREGSHMLVFNPTEDAITLHGLGFLQIKLQAGQRLHVWHPELPRRECFAHSAIHDHRFSFTSRVLVGTQINHLYTVAQHKDVTPAPTHRSYLHEGERTRFGNRPWLPDGDLTLIHHGTEVVEAGQNYQMRAYVYHSTEPGGNGRVATLMRKTWEGDRGAHSLCEIGFEPDVDFDRQQWPGGLLWEIVAEVLGGDHD